MPRVQFQYLSKLRQFGHFIRPILNVAATAGGNSTGHGPARQETRRQEKTLLLEAIWSGNSRAVEELLSRGFDARSSVELFGDEWRDPDYSAWVLPALAANQRWRDIQAPNGFHDVVITGHPLIDAVNLGHVDIARRLIQGGANINSTFEGFAVRPGARLIGAFEGPPLVIACGKGDTAMVKLLLSEGADTGVLNRDHTSPLQVAAACGNAEIVKMLLDHGADCRNRQVRIVGDDAHYLVDGPLKAAAANGHEDVVRLLLQGGADARQVKDWSLDKAKEHPGVIALLESAKAGDGGPAADRPGGHYSRALPGGLNS